MRLGAGMAGVLTVWAGAGLANDGFGGLTATGLTFGQTAQIAMLDEDLAISPDRIAVDYVFKNTSDADISGEVIFPLPPIALGDLMNSDWNLPEDRARENLVDFQVTVDGRAVMPQIDRVAVIQPENYWEMTPAQTYDTPGTDVTAKLAQFGLPLSLDAEDILARLAAMTPAQRKVLRQAGLIDSYDGDPDSADVYPLWAIVLRYHWTQDFPAGQAVSVHHAYENHPTGGVFQWADPPSEDYLQEVAQRYCVDKGTSRAIMKAISKPDQDGVEQAIGLSWNIAYVLRTANSWAGPIGHFKLTLDKGSPKNVISLCADGVTKTGPTTFVVEKTDFVPDRDLEILIVEPGQF